MQNYKIIEISVMSRGTTLTSHSTVGHRFVSQLRGVEAHRGLEKWATSEESEETAFPEKL